MLSIEVFSDLACPWCYVGKRNLEIALAATGIEAEVRFRSFELDPTMAPDAGRSIEELLATKYNMTTEQAKQANDHLTGVAAAAGLEYHLDQLRPGNTVDAHRLAKFAELRGLGLAMEERLFIAYFTEGQLLSDHETLTRLGVEVGLDDEELRSFLASDELLSLVRRDEAEAAALGITSVPTFIIDGRYAVPGAQDVATMSRVLTQASAKS
jgi:hypothetical protein